METILNKQLCRTEGGGCDKRGTSWVYTRLSFRLQHVRTFSSADMNHIVSIVFLWSSQLGGCFWQMHRRQELWLQPPQRWSRTVSVVFTIAIECCRSPETNQRTASSVVVWMLSQEQEGLTVPPVIWQAAGIAVNNTTLSWGCSRFYPVTSLRHWL